MARLILLLLLLLLLLYGSINIHVVCLLWLGSLQLLVHLCTLC